MLKSFQTGDDLDFDHPVRKLVPHKNVSAPVGRPSAGSAILEAEIRSGGNPMKIWSKPEVREQEVGFEVTSYLPAEIDII